MKKNYEIIKEKYEIDIHENLFQTKVKTINDRTKVFPYKNEMPITVQTEYKNEPYLFHTFKIKSIKSIDLNLILLGSIVTIFDFYKDLYSKEIQLIKEKKDYFINDAIFHLYKRYQNRFPYYSRNIMEII